MKTFYLILSMVMLGMTDVHAQQQDFVYSGVVVDGATLSPLRNVRIYCLDTVPVYSDRQGKFQIKEKEGVKFHFRRAGYAWHTVTMTGESEQTVCLLKSNRSLQKRIYRKYPKDKTVVLYDGKPVAYEEWGDAFSTDSSEIQSINMLSGEKANEKYKVMIQSIFRWNRKNF